MTNREFTAVYKKSGKWVVAWVEEIPGINTQGRTKKEALENLKEAALLVLAENRKIISSKSRGFSRELFSVSLAR
ncbi:MAG: type II toxin-antitoxin system HicB family antitoxin [Candidatus Paceibacterota bacterium]|jgi:predicted RNase H-like HicB family nuclease